MNPRDQSRKVAIFLGIVNLVHVNNWHFSASGRLYTAAKALDTPTLYIILVQYQVSLHLHQMGSSVKSGSVASKITTISKVVELLTEELERRFPDERTPG